MGKIIVANYKMNGSITFFNEVKKSLNNLKLKDTKLILCPSFVYLSTLKSTKIARLGAQDLGAVASQKSTGQVSVDSLKELNVKYALIGHNDRRILGETNGMIAEKVALAIKNNIIPIVCVGESTKNLRLSSLKTDVISALSKVKKRVEVIFAYEPVWAISSGRNASVERINKVVNFIKNLTIELGIRSKILYGGSVSKRNINELKNSEADGFLIGKQSLDLGAFISILKEVDET